MNITIKKYLQIIITIILLILIFIYLKSIGINPLIKKQNPFLADVSINKIGYTCDRFSGICEVDTISAEYTNKNSCQQACSNLRYKWYCNTTLGQCTRDFRGTYNNLETCWKNCYDKVSYYCDIRDGLCKAGNIYGNQVKEKLAYIQTANMNIQECSSKCRPATKAYLYNENNKKCTWANPETKHKDLISWNECVGLSKSDNTIKYSKQPAYANTESPFAIENKLEQLLGFNPYSLGKIIHLKNLSYNNNAYFCAPTPTGEYSSFESCFQSLNNGYHQYQNYSGYNCDYPNGQCILVTDNAEFQSTTLEDAHNNCINNCNPFLDNIIQYDYNCRFPQKSSETIIDQNPKLHACYISNLTTIPSGKICCNNDDCKIFNNWICTHKNADNISTLVFNAIDLQTCVKNKWDWLGKIEQKCICQKGNCAVSNQPLPGINIDPRCGDNTCDTLERYIYLHSGSYKNSNNESSYQSPSMVKNRFYCPSDCD